MSQQKEKEAESLSRKKPYDWCPCDKRRLGHRLGSSPMRAQRCLQARERGSEEASPANSFILDFQPPGWLFYDIGWLLPYLNMNQPQDPC
ncbi:hypothetical protein AB1E18_015371 [Capra hircus]